MEWSALAQLVQLRPVQEDAIGRLLTSLNHEFEALCSRPWTGRQQSPVDVLARFIVDSQADHETASKRMLELLQEPDGPGTTRMFAVQSAESHTNAQVESLLNPEQLARWNIHRPFNLLDIDIGLHPISDRIAKEVDRLRRPDGFFCTSPFEYAHVQANGDVYPCCPSKFGRIIGNLKIQTLAEIWNSQEARDVRDSMVDGSYRYCNGQACEYLREANARGKPLSPRALVEWAEGQGLTRETSSPRVVNFAFDKSCNLSCSYCRTDTFRPSASDLRVIRNIDSNIFSTLLQSTERIILLGEGDPFASPFYREKLQSYDWSCHPNLRIKIQTNGLLLTPQMWNSIERSHCAIDWISVSVDAATDGTYALNRKGDFHLLLENLEFIARLLAAGSIRHFHINFLVQANNFREIPRFVELGKRLGCDLIEFQRLENWGTYTEFEYRQRAVHEQSHQDHEELLKVLRDPILTHPKVWLLKLGDCVPQIKAMSVISYNKCV